MFVYMYVAVNHRQKFPNPCSEVQYIRVYGRLTYACTISQLAPM